MNGKNPQKFRLKMKPYGVEYFHAETNESDNALLYVLRKKCYFCGFLVFALNMMTDRNII